MNNSPLHLVSQFQILAYISSQQFAPRGMALTHVSADIHMERQRTLSTITISTMRDL